MPGTKGKINGKLIDLIPKNVFSCLNCFVERFSEKYSKKLFSSNASYYDFKRIFGGGLIYFSLSYPYPYIPEYTLIVM